MSRKYKQMPRWFQVKTVLSEQIFAEFTSCEDAVEYAKQQATKWQMDYQVYSTKTNTTWNYAPALYA
jgi:hypothetical protein